MKNWYLVNILLAGWTADSFTNWLTQQAVNIPTKVANMVTSFRNPVQTGMTISGNILSTIGEFYSAKLMPSIEGGQNTGDVNFAAQNNTFRYRCMRIKKEYLEIVDNYFTRFGYKINRIKTPNITGRLNFNYVEIGQNDDIGYGDVPQKYMQEINSIARKGVTIWHNHSNLGDFTVTNTIVTP